MSDAIRPFRIEIPQSDVATAAHTLDEQARSSDRGAPPAVPFFALLK